MEGSSGSGGGHVTHRAGKSPTNNNNNYMSELDYMALTMASPQYALAAWQRAALERTASGLVSPGASRAALGLDAFTSNGSALKRDAALLTSLQERLRHKSGSGRHQTTAYDMLLRRADSTPPSASRSRALTASASSSDLEPPLLVTSARGNDTERQSGSLNSSANTVRSSVSESVRDDVSDGTRDDDVDALPLGVIKVEPVSGTCMWLAVVTTISISLN